jgi:hypothetical protein
MTKKRALIALICATALEECVRGGITSAEPVNYVLWGLMFALVAVTAW